jgi:hypothetical protein
MLVGADDCGIDHRVFIVEILSQTLKHPLPDAASTPACMACVDHAEISEPLRQIPPRDPRTIPIQNRFDK